MKKFDLRAKQIHLSAVRAQVRTDKYFSIINIATATIESTSYKKFSVHRRRSAKKSNSKRVELLVYQSTLSSIGTQPSFQVEKFYLTFHKMKRMKSHNHKSKSSSKYMKCFFLEFTFALE